MTTLLLLYILIFPFRLAVLLFLYQVGVRKHNRVYHMSGFTVANDTCDVRASEGIDNMLTNVGGCVRSLASYLLHPLRRSISIELYSAKPFPISISSHSFMS